MGKNMGGVIKFLPAFISSFGSVSPVKILIAAVINMPPFIFGPNKKTNSKNNRAKNNKSEAMRRQRKQMAAE